MSGLVGYGSSDEDENEERPSVEIPKRRAENPLQNTVPEVEISNGTLRRNDDASSSAVLGRSKLASPQGPAQGPSLDVASEPVALNGSESSAPSSPYTANRSAIRSLTLPPTPNLDIPPSPPGSPSPEMDAKINHFLNLKKRGIHFNSKLAASSALKNPGLLPKLMDSAGLTDQNDQYKTTLPEDLWSPAGFPPWAYKEELARSQQEVAKKKEAEKRGMGREFVSATNDTADSGRPGRNASAAERVMAGLSGK